MLESGQAGYFQLSPNRLILSLPKDIHNPWGWFDKLTTSGPGGLTQTIKKPFRDRKVKLKE